MQFTTLQQELGQVWTVHPYPSREVRSRLDLLCGYCRVRNWGLSNGRAFYALENVIKNRVPCRNIR